MHSRTGHSDVVMGVVCTNNEELSKKLRYLQNGKANTTATKFNKNLNFACSTANTNNIAQLLIDKSFLPSLYDIDTSFVSEVSSGSLYLPTPQKLAKQNLPVVPCPKKFVLWI